MAVWCLLKRPMLMANYCYFGVAGLVLHVAIIEGFAVDSPGLLNKARGICYALFRCVIIRFSHCLNSILVRLVIRPRGVIPVTPAAVLFVVLLCFIPGLLQVWQ